MTTPGFLQNPCMDATTQRYAIKRWYPDLSHPYTVDPSNAKKFIFRSLAVLTVRYEVSTKQQSPALDWAFSCEYESPNCPVTCVPKRRAYRNVIFQTEHPRARELLVEVQRDNEIAALTLQAVIEPQGISLAPTDTKKPAHGGLSKSSRWPVLVSGLQGLSGLSQNSFVLFCFTRHKGWISARRSF